MDPRRGNAVVPSREAYDRQAVGVASAGPALLMGGSAFSLEQLERSWGAEAVRLFESERAELEAQILARDPRLAEESPIALFDRVMERFFDRHIVSVALAGRIPILADAGRGPYPGSYRCCRSTARRFSSPSTTPERSKACSAASTWC